MAPGQGTPPTAIAATLVVRDNRLPIPFFRLRFHLLREMPSLIMSLPRRGQRPHRKKQPLLLYTSFSCLLWVMLGPVEPGVQRLEDSVFQRETFSICKVPQNK